MEVYEGVVDYLKNFTVDERDMTKYIIGTISNIDRPMNPAAKGDRSMNLYMNHVSQEPTQKVIWSLALFLAVFHCRICR